MYKVVDNQGFTRISPCLDSLPLHKDWIDINSLEEI